MSKLILIWDYDSALGQINATYPYKFDYEKIFQEIKNVDQILELGKNFDINMVFACLGFAAEEGTYPYSIPEQIQKIYAHGHEIASHSWRHEWFPHLEKQQIQRSLERSKHSLESCIGIKGCVKGFVPPFNRPMSWFRKGSISLGDRALYPFFPGAELDSVLRYVQETGYSWCRVSYHPLFHRIIKPKKLENFQIANGIFCVRSSYFGFDEPALRLLDLAILEDRILIISAHPSGLSRSKEESIEHFLRFIKRVAAYQEKGLLQSVTIQEYLATLENAPY